MVEEFYKLLDLFLMRDDTKVLVIMLKNRL